jgi:hypothetical protein
MGTVHDFRSYETAARRHRNKPHVYQALVRRMVRKEQQGESAREVLAEAFDLQRRGDEPEGAA